MRKAQIRDFIISSWLAGVTLDELFKSHRKGKITIDMYMRFVAMYRKLDEKQLLVLEEFKKIERKAGEKK